MSSGGQSKIAQRQAARRAEAVRSRSQRCREQRATRLVLRRALKRVDEFEAQTDELRENQLGFYQQTLRLQEVYLATLRQLGGTQAWIRSAQEQRLLMSDQLDNLTRLAEQAVVQAQQTAAAPSTVQTRDLARRLQAQYRQMTGDVELKQLLAPPPQIDHDAYFPPHVAERALDGLESYQPEDPFEYDHHNQSQLPVPRPLSAL